MTLPAGWDVARLTDLIGADGVFTDGDWVETKDQDPGGEIRLTQLADVGEGLWRDRSERHMTLAAAQRLGCTFLEPDDVLVARMPDPLGRACVFPGDTRRCVTAVDVCIVRPGTSGVDARWLMWWLNTPRIRQDVLGLQAGTTRKRISRKNLATIPLPIPPLSEQRRIVAAIEEQLSRLEAARSELSSLRLRLVAGRRSAISAAMRDPDWPPIKIGDIGDGSRNALAIGPFGSNLKVSDYQQEGVPLIFVRNIRARQFGDSRTRFVSVEKAEELASHRVRRGDVLITKMGDPPGDTTVYPEGQPDAIITADCIKVSVGADFDPHFVALAIEGPEARKQVLSYTQGVAQRKVSLGRFKKVLIPAPPLEVQRRVAAQLDNFFNSLRALELTAHDTERKSAALRSAILGSAFRGQLVPQDPDDEPASILLARIAAEHTATPKPARQRRHRTPA